MTSSRILSLNIPVEHHHPSSLNIEIEDEDDDEEDEVPVDRCNESNEQLEVFVGFYRPGEYQRETMEDDDDEQTSESSEKSNEQKKDEQVMFLPLNNRSISLLFFFAFHFSQLEN